MAGRLGTGAVIRRQPLGRLRGFPLRMRPSCAKAAAVSVRKLCRSSFTALRQTGPDPLPAATSRHSYDQTTDASSKAILAASWECDHIGGDINQTPAFGSHTSGRAWIRYNDAHEHAG